MRGVLLQFPADHLMYDPVRIGCRNFFRSDVMAVAQDCNRVAKPEDFLQPVRYVNDGDATLLEFGQQLEQVLAFAHRK